MERDGLFPALSYSIAMMSAHPIFLKNLGLSDLANDLLKGTLREMEKNEKDSQSPT